jgi:hypothetical protein
MSQQFIDISSSRGAPIGRASYGLSSDCPSRSIRLFRVIFYDGDYDDGGAYWGGGINTLPLYCARYGNTYRAFARAKDRRSAMLALHIPSALLADPIAKVES